MDSDPPPEHFLYPSLDKKQFPATLWRLVNDPANDSVVWDSSGEAVIIDQRLFEKELLSQGEGLQFKSFYRQLNLYGFKKIHGSVRKMGCRHFRNPNFKRGHPELIQHLTRNTVKNRLKRLGHKTPHQVPDTNETLLEDGEGIASPVPGKNPITVNPGAAGNEHQQRSFPQTVLYQVYHEIQPGVVASITVNATPENSPDKS